MPAMIDIEQIDFKNENDLFLVPVGISNRHLHLTREDLDVLYGPGYELTPIKDLTQPGQFAAEETVNVVGPKGSIEKMRILGPLRSRTQIELAQTDARKIGIKAPLRLSGDLDGTPGCVLVGPKGYILLKEGVIIAKTHLHLSLQEGAERGFQDGDLADVYFYGLKKMCLMDVVVRVSDACALDLHMDTDEANACLTNNGAKAYVVKKG